jgi:hypothetical protein
MCCPFTVNKKPIIPPFSLKSVNLDGIYAFSSIQIKELDLETGLYYYGARYLNPKTSMWISADPAMGDYIPSAPVDDEARKRNGNLPGMGGVYNYVNFHVYHYAGNNPVKLVDPTGMFVPDIIEGTIVCDLNNISDMGKASILFDGSLYTQVMALDEKSGLSITFNTPEAMNSFLSIHSEGIDLSSIDLASIESVISTLGMGATVVSLIKISKPPALPGDSRGLTIPGL